MYQAFIIEDEAPARSRIKKMLLSYPKDIEVLGEADHGKAAIEQIESLQPAVLFLDIQLPDMTGFELLARLTYQPLVIFTTAYESYAIQAFETYSIDYLVKPFDAERLKKAIDKLKKFGDSKNRPDYVQLEKLISQPIQKPVSNTLALKLGDRIILLDHEEISYLKAEDKYARIYLENGKKHLSSQSLGKLESILPANFIRVHRSYIINQKSIAEVRKYFKGKLILIMKDKERTSITTGEKYSADVKATLGI